MTWVLTKVARAANANVPRLLQSVTMEFANLDGNGVAIATHTYTEPNVSDVSDAGVARLARDQMAQLERISVAPVGAADVPTIAALITGMAPPAAKTPTQAEIDAAAARAAIAGALQLRISHLKAIELGLAQATDQDVLDTKTTLDDAVKSDRALVFSLL